MATTAMERLAIARTFTATYRTGLKNQLRYYSFWGWTLTAILSPIFLLASAWIISSFVAGGGIPERFFQLTGFTDYLAFVALGLAFNGFVLAALSEGGDAIYSEETAGTWDLLALTPMSRFAWMLAKTLSGMVMSFIDFAMVIGVGALVFGIHLSWASAPVALAGILLTLVALQGFAFLMAALGLAWKQPQALAVLLSPILIFLSGMMFPVAALPPWIQAVAKAFPLTHGLEILRHALLGGASFWELRWAFAWLALTGAAFMTIGFASFRIMERRALRRGGLGRY